MTYLVKYHPEKKRMIPIATNDLAYIEVCMVVFKFKRVSRATYENICAAQRGME